VHHAPTILLRSRQLRERLALHGEVVARAVGAPFYGYEAGVQCGEGCRRGEWEAGGLVQIGAFAGDGGVDGRGKRVVDYADDGGAVHGEAEGDGDVRVAVDEVRSEDQSVKSAKLSQECSSMVGVQESSNL
jgi:hypothetical protein